MLTLTNVEVVYSDVIWILKGVSLSVPEKGIVSLLGANGMGKTTTLKAISGLLHVELGKVTSGTIKWDETSLVKKSPQEVAKLGIVQVMEERKIFEHLTVEENLLAAGTAQNVRNKLKEIYAYFPQLKAVRNRVSGYCSGGEQQMLVVGRALMLDPKLLLLDEPTLGLAPLVINEMFGIIKAINDTEGTSILLVEQNAEIALKLSSYTYIMENGKIVMDGPSEKLMDNPDIKEFYMGLTEVGEKKSFRSVKHYRRRKRWLA